MTSPPNGVRARSLSGRALLATLGLWFLLSALCGAGTVFVARSLASAWGHDSNNVTPVIVAEVYAALVFAAVIVLGRRVQTVAALNPRSRTLVRPGLRRARNRVRVDSVLPWAAGAVHRCLVERRCTPACRRLGRWPTRDGAPWGGGNHCVAGMLSCAARRGAAVSRAVVYMVTSAFVGSVDDRDHGRCIFGDSCVPTAPSANVRDRRGVWLEP
jgi:hypothetical protein